MNAIDIINKTKHSQILTHEEISWLVSSYTNGYIPDYQMSAWLMAVCLNGLTEEETLALTYASYLPEGSKLTDNVLLVVFANCAFEVCTALH